MEGGAVKILKGSRGIVLGCSGVYLGHNLLRCAFGRLPGVCNRDFETSVVVMMPDWCFGASLFQTESLSGLPTTVLLLSLSLLAFSLKL